MEFIPHNYQKAAIDFVKQHPSAALLLDCGLGKTVILLTANKEMRLASTLVVCPKLVVDSWLREVDKWDHLKDIKVVAVKGTVEQRMKALQTPAHIHIISRDNIAWLAKLCDLNQFDMIVMDESSSFKDETSARTAALMNHPSPRKVILTGTPMPKNIEDLYSQYKILDGGKRLESTIDAFRRRYMFVEDYSKRKYKPLDGAEQTIYRRIGDITMSMKSDELLHLPTLTNVTNEVYMTSEEQAIFDELRTNYSLEYDGVVIDADNSGVLTNKLAQLSNGFFYDKDKQPHFFHNHKTEMLESILEASVGNGEDVIVAYNYQEDMDRIKDVCKRMNYPALDLKQSKNVAKFIEPGERRVALLHPKSGGMGLNLQEYCHRLVWYSLPYSYEEWYQTVKRVWRQGQKYTTYLHTIEAANSYDQRIRHIVNGKGECNDRLIEATKCEIQEIVTAYRARTAC